MTRKLNFEKYFDCLLKIMPLNVAALATMTIYRIFFFLYFQNFSSFKGFYGYIFKAFLLGIRFDLSVLAYVNIFVIAVFTSFLIIKNLNLLKVAIFVIKIHYYIAFTTILLSNAIDFGFYLYFGEHINILIFDFFADDKLALIKTIIYDLRFPSALLILIFASFLTYKLVSLTAKKLTSKHSYIDTSFWNIFIKIFTVFFVPFLIFCMARGTTSMFPLGKFHTQISPNPFINNLSITSVHSLIDAVSIKMKQQSNKIDIAEKLKINKDEIDLSVFCRASIKNDEAKKVKPHVIFIVLEGFGELPILYNSNNFDVLGELKQHFDKDTVLYNFLAAGSITIHCLESTILNMPQRPFSLQITQSPKAFNTFTSSLVLPYKKSGYITKMVYGGSLAWRGIEGFLKTQGFDETYGEGSIKNEYRHEWGINDAQFFEMILRELKNNNGTPKFIYAMSTATHPPYETPPYYKPLKLKIPREIIQMMPNEKKYGRQIFKNYQFANREAAKFLSAIKKSEFAENTIIVITGDHNLREFKANIPEELFKKYAVPMYIYMPEKLKKPIDTNIAACHMDIIPTLYDLSLSNKKYTAAGISMLSGNTKHIAFNSEGLILSNNKAISYNVETGNVLYFNFDPKTKMLSKTEETKDHKEMLKYYKKILATSDVYLNQNNGEKK
ncbi:MAG: sulfatase-like hydrolase/transferase [Endomicrobium sp.]|jgi:phosphoglycerol transferase MdoB-like AlkP superfamily enzyme|nr:sulfatase-like hydrolase/transferase [Endomicrobium sp.]